MDTSSSPQLSPPPVVKTLPAPDHLTQLPEHATAPARRSPLVLLILIVGVLVVGIGVGVFATLVMNPQPRSGRTEGDMYQPPVEPTPSPMPVATGVSQMINAEQTYTNDAGKFQLILPDGWGATKGSQTSFYIAPSERIANIEIFEGGSGKGMVSEVQILSSIELANLPDNDPAYAEMAESTVVMNGVEVYKQVKTMKQDSPLGVVGDVITTYTFPLEDGTQFLRLTLLDSQYIAEFEQIVASFTYIQ